MTLKRTPWNIAAIFFLCLFFTACTSSVPTATETLATQSVSSNGYPYPAPSLEIDNLSGYPGPQFITPQPTIDIGNVPPLEIPTPTSGLGIVRGKFSLLNPDRRIILIADIFLASIVNSEGNISVPFIRLDPDNDPVATLRNQIDEFAILDVPPGEYGMVLHGPLTDYVVPDADSPVGFLIVVVKPNEITDIGVIEIK